MPFLLVDKEKGGCLCVWLKYTCKSDSWLKMAGTQRAGLFELCLSSALVGFVTPHWNKVKNIFQKSHRISLSINSGKHNCKIVLTCAVLIVLLFIAWALFFFFY